MNLGDTLGAAALLISGGGFCVMAKYMGRCERKFQQLDDVTEEVYTQQNTVVREVRPAQVAPPKRPQQQPSRVISGGQVRQKQIAAPTRSRKPAATPKDDIYHPRSAELFQGQYEGDKVYYHE